MTLYRNSLGDLIIPSNFTFQSPNGYKYRFIRKVGNGTFGNVYCAIEESNPSEPQYRAIKVTKSQPQLYAQAQNEIVNMQKLMENTNEEEKQNISILYDFFNYNGNLCIVMENLSCDLLTIIEKRRPFGLPLLLIQSVSINLLKALITLKKNEIIHCDIKPENVMLLSNTSPNVKLIDFGSARDVERAQDFYIQSRYYRAPEIILNVKYSYSIDMWSLGCLLFELFTLIPLFPGQDEFQMLFFIEKYIGPFPDWLLSSSNVRNKYFKADGRLKPQELYYMQMQTCPPVKYDCFKYNTIDEIILNFNTDAEQTLSACERNQRLMFISFLHDILKYDPAERLTPEEAMSHPFILAELSP